MCSSCPPPVTLTESVSDLQKGLTLARRDRTFPAISISVTACHPLWELHRAAPERRLETPDTS